MAGPDPGPASGVPGDMSFTGSEARAWYAIAVLCLALLLSFTDRFVINLVVDPIRAELGFSDLEISLLQGAGFAVIFALAGPPSGWLADRVHRRNLIAAGLVLWSLATVACGLATDFGSFLAARIAVGLGEAALIPAASSLIVDSFVPRRRGLALGIFSLGAVFGTGTALLVGGALLAMIGAGRTEGLAFLAALAPWRQLLILVGLPGLLLLPLLLLMREPPRGAGEGGLRLAGLWSFLVADGAMVLRVCLVKAVLAVGDYALIAWLPTMLQRGHGLTPLEAGGLVGISISASGAVAALGGGALADRVARRWGVRSRVILLLGSYSLAVAGAAAVLLAGSPATLGWAFALWVLGSTSGYVIGHVVMQENVPNDMRATTIALSLAATALIGISLGPVLVPLVDAALGGGALHAAAGIVSLSAALLALGAILAPACRALTRLRQASDGA